MGIRFIGSRFLAASANVAQERLLQTFTARNVGRPAEPKKSKPGLPRQPISSWLSKADFPGS
jgi:hypothetical protein